VRGAAGWKSRPRLVRKSAGLIGGGTRGIRLRPAPPAH